MMRSLYSGVSGLKTHQVRMDVIGNNIANVNTVAYKSQSITFSELMYQTTQSASGPNETTGTAGRNAKQIGLGVTSGAISTAITTQGSTQTTGNAFDLRITGDSFFVVNDGNSNFFTRDGSFYVDAAGNLAMSSNGYNVMGWLPEENKETGEISIKQDTVTKLQILSADNLTSPPRATEKAVINGVLDKNDTNVKSTDGKSINLSFYDNLGYSYTARFAISGTDAEGKYILALKDVLDSNNDSIIDPEKGGRFNASIFTGSDATGSESYADKAANYSLLDGYVMDASGEVYKASNDTEKWKPSDFLDSDGKITNQEIATKYAAAFGYDKPEDFFNLTVKVKDGTETVDTRIGKILSSSATGNYTNAGGTATSLFSVVDGKTVLGVDGYMKAAGDAVAVYYDQASGKFLGVNSKTGAYTSFSLNITPKNPASDNPFEDIAVDMTDSLNYNNEGSSTIGATSGDKKGYGTGCALGNMTGVSIQNNGMIYGAYDNGQTKLLGQIAVANFSNASGLEKEGDNLYKATLNSGEFDGIGVDITTDGGYISTGVLEMSNVDLSSEFTDLITTQRGFQANSRIITVSDTLLEELVNLKR